MSHSPTPTPRPALQKAADGSVHPASPVLSSLAVTLPADRRGLRTAGQRPGKKGSKPDEPEDEVELVVVLPKHVRKALRKRAAEYGWSAEEAAAQVLRVWADH
jgi:hypothetical protein